jgi:hypothetical protein
MGDQVIDGRLVRCRSGPAQGRDNRGAENRYGQPLPARLEIVAPDPRGEGAVGGLGAAGSVMGQGSDFAR